MTKQEIEKAIKNGESVWVVKDKGKTIYEVTLNKFSAYVKDNSFYANTMLPYKLDPHYICSIDEVKTKAEAEHYLHHGNIARTETLPFVTWEEFLKEYKIYFNNFKHSRYILCAKNNKILLFNVDCLSKQDNEWDLTEENFYKAYDECVRLFRGVE